MAKISLRQYLREINTLIESKKIDLAFEHCKHILKSYPKYIDIYRLLGKAYLESSRYEEAEGMFRRVLAVLPDDFVSHLGLSVVKEENNDLDTAIWHMERAYELKSTQTIHEELHRLFTQRDGVAPPKPLITRGALIRINVRSGLYQQALKEIDLALKEDSQRIDLEILRAQIYYKLNNIPNTLKYCQQVIRKRPYAYDINTILAEIAESPEQAEPFKQRLYELDPYTSFVTESTSLSNVQDDLIMIEKLDLQPAKETEQADETQEVGDDTINQEEYDDTQEVSVADESEDSFEDSTLLEAQSHESAHIPDWMKEAGWEAGTPKPPEEEQALIEQYDEASDLPDLEMDNAIDELEEEDLPEWIKDFAPADAARDELPSLFTEEGDEEEEKIAWLDAILSGEEGQQPVSSPEEPERMDEPSKPKGMPAFGEDLEADQEWLEKISTQEGLMAEQQQSEDRPSRMPTSEEMNQFVFQDDEEDVETPEEPAAIDYLEETYAEEADEDDIDSAIAWLEGLAAKQGADEEVLFSTPEARDEQPEWIFDDEEQQATKMSEEPIQETQQADSSLEVEMDDETIPSIEIPSQESTTAGVVEEAPEEITTEETVEFAAEVEVEETEAEAEEEEEEEDFEFAFEYDQEIGSPEALADAVETDEESQDVPEWLKAIAPPEKVTKPLPADVPLEQVEEELAEIVEEVSLEDEFEEEEEWDQLLTEEEEEQEAESIPDAERLATTAVLDFIKQQAESDVSEIDEWLKNLPDLPEDMPALEEEMEEDIPVTDEETGKILSAMKQEREHGPVDFIDDFFSEGIDEEEPELAASGDEPYQWEQIFEDDDLPDWISDISEDDLGESVAQLDSTQERDSELPDMPAWIAGEDDSEDEEILQETQESEPMASLEELEEETLDVVEEEIEPEPIAETEVPISVTEEAPEVDELEMEEGELPAKEEKQHEIAFEELFILAKNQLHNGEFDEAHPLLEQLMQDDQWTQDVIDVLLFDIENYHPIEVHSWMLLGDAYRKQDNLQQALDAYTKAEGFIK
jgi:tetratricopeptide (TPR) repeat protein